MLNKAIIKKFEVWDGETGEADVTAQFNNGVQLKAFSLDSFKEDDEMDVLLTLFCKDSEVIDETLIKEITNTNDKYQVTLQGEIIDFINDDEQGEIVVVDVGNIFINIYSATSEISKDSIGKYFRGVGRLDIETETIS